MSPSQGTQVPKATGLKDYLQKRKARFFYLTRRLHEIHSNQPKPVERVKVEKQRVETVIPTVDVFENRNKFSALEDEIDRIPPRGAQREAAVDAICTKIETTNAGILHGRVYTEDPIRLKAKLERGQHLIRNRAPFVRRGSLPAISSDLVDRAVQSTHADTSVGTDTLINENGVPLDVDTVGLLVPKRREINKIVKNKRIFRAHSRLLFYLRCKYHLAHRDHQFMNKLVTEARIWMVKNGYQCDKAEDYTILSSAVMAAFLVSSEELEFRQVIKNRVNFGNMLHLNDTVRGQLGHTWRPLNRGGHLLGGLLPTNSLRPPTSVV